MRDCDYWLRKTRMEILLSVNLDMGSSHDTVLPKTTLAIHADQHARSWVKMGSESSQMWSEWADTGLRWKQSGRLEVPGRIFSGQTICLARWNWSRERFPSSTHSILKDFWFYAGRFGRWKLFKKRHLVSGMYLGTKRARKNWDFGT